MVEQQFASALLSISETLMFPVVWTPASRMPVGRTQIVPGVDRELFVHVGPATWAPPTAGLAAVPTLVSQGSAVQVPSAKTLEAGPSVSVCLVTRETLTQDGSRESAMRTKTVDHSERVRTTNASTLVPSRVARVPTAPCKTMWPFAGVPGEPLEIHSATVADSPERRSALPVVPTLTVRWDLMTGQSVVARTPTLGTRCRVADMNATRTMSAASPRSVTGSPIGVRLPVVKECVGKTPTAKL